jgi:4'-phosphopantetheinyl transferase
MKAQVILQLVQLQNGFPAASGPDRRPSVRARTREAVRLLAARELNVDADRMRLAFDCRQCTRGNDGRHGQPHLLLDGAPAPARLSYARSGRWLLAALSFRPVLLGVDIEDAWADAFRPEDNIDAVMLTQSERTLVAQAADPRLLRARLWTRKEAVLKSTGHGLRLPPDTIGVAGAEGEPQLSGWPGEAGDRPGLQLLDLTLADAGGEVPPGLAAALAVGGSADPKITYRETAAVQG